MVRSTASRRARNSDSDRIGGRVRRCSRPSRRRWRLASSRVEPDTPCTSSRAAGGWLDRHLRGHEQDRRGGRCPAAPGGGGLLASRCDLVDHRLGWGRGAPAAGRCRFHLLCGGLAAFGACGGLSTGTPCRRLPLGLGRWYSTGTGTPYRCLICGGLLNRRAGPIVPRRLVLEHPDVLQFWLPGRVERSHAGTPHAIRCRALRGTPFVGAGTCWYLGATRERGAESLPIPP